MWVDNLVAASLQNRFILSCYPGMALTAYFMTISCLLSLLFIIQSNRVNFLC